MFRTLRPVAAILALALLAVTAALFAAPGANAGGTFVVDTTADDPAKNACTSDPDDCSLRGAITLANSTPGHNTIALSNGETYILTVAGTGDNDNQTGDLDITDSVTIQGNNATVDGDGIDRVFEIVEGTTGVVVLRDMTITGGLQSETSFFVDSGGGGVAVRGGTVTLLNLIVENNESKTGGGGIQIRAADVVITNVQVLNNKAADSGGGIMKSDAINNSLKIEDSLIGANTARHGGGIATGLSSSILIEDTTINGNTATFDCTEFGTLLDCNDGGGGLEVFTSPPTILGGTISGNMAPLGAGGGIRAAGVKVDGTVITNNTAGGRGGGIQANVFEVVNATVANNSAGAGGGLSGAGTIFRSSIVGNSALGDGGGVFALRDLEIGQSLIANNTAQGNGGGGHFEGGVKSITNSTISGNNAAMGGGIYRGSDIEITGGAEVAPQGAVPVPGALTVTHATIASNTSNSGGANVHYEGTLNLFHVRGSIIADGVPNCNGPIPSDGFNVEDADTCGLNAAGDRPDSDPVLQNLASNGGPTHTRALGVGSAAVDAVTSGCPPPTVDQRGAPRPLGNACDAGAFESNLSAPTPTGGPTPSPTPSPTPTGEPTPTPTLVAVIWGDNLCDGEVDTGDAIPALQYTAGVAPEAGEGDCPIVGDAVIVAGDQFVAWGDVNCSGPPPDPADSLRILAAVAGITENVPDCPQIGDAVNVVVVEPQ